MIRILAFLLICLFILFPTQEVWAQQHWKVAHTEPDAAYYKVVFGSLDTGIVCTRLYTAPSIRTTDGGKSWTPVTVSPDKSFLSAYAASPTLYFLGSSAADAFYGKPLVCRSTDAGFTWSNDTLSTVGFVFSFSFPSLDTGYAITCSGRVGCCGGVFRTTDQGVSWQLIHKIEAEGNGGWAVSFRDGRHGVICVASDPDYEEVTSDAGFTWTKVENSPALVTSMVRPSSSVVLGLNVSNLFKSYNEFQDWSLIYPSFYSNGALSVIDSAAYCLYLTEFGDRLQDYGVFRITRDGGQTWTVGDSVYGHGVRDMHFVTPKKGFLIFDSIIYVTEDAGGTLGVAANEVPNSARIWYTSDRILHFPDTLEAQAYEIAIYDLLGRKVLRSKINQGESILDCKALNPGVYYARTTFGFTKFVVAQ